MFQFRQTCFYLDKLIKSEHKSIQLNKNVLTTTVSAWKSLSADNSFSAQATGNESKGAVEPCLAFFGAYNSLVLSMIAVNFCTLNACKVRPIRSLAVGLIKAEICSANFFLISPFQQDIAFSAGFSIGLYVGNLRKGNILENSFSTFAWDFALSKMQTVCELLMSSPDETTMLLDTICRKFPNDSFVCPHYFTS